MEWELSMMILNLLLVRKGVSSTWRNIEETGNYFGKKYKLGNMESRLLDLLKMITKRLLGRAKV